MPPPTSVILSLLLLGVPPTPRTVGTGAWSSPVQDSRGQGIQARTVVTQGRFLGERKIRETCVYVEIRNASEAVGEPLQIYVDPHIQWTLRDAKGEPVPQTPGGFSGGVPGAGWYLLPYDATLRLRVNPYGSGRADGLLLQLIGANWMIPAGMGKECFLSGTLKLDPEDAADRRPAWRGTVKLPPVRLSVGTDRL